jgi:hypothetical protein
MELHFCFIYVPSMCGQGEFLSFFFLFYLCLSVLKFLPNTSRDVFLLGNLTSSDAKTWKRCKCLLKSNNLNVSCCRFLVTYSKPTIVTSYQTDCDPCVTVELSGGETCFLDKDTQLMFGNSRSVKGKCTSEIKTIKTDRWH